MTDVFWIAVGSALFLGTFGYMGWQSWQEEKKARRRREWERHMVFLRAAVRTFPALQVAMLEFGRSAIKAAAEFDKVRFLIEHRFGIAMTDPKKPRIIEPPT